MDSYKGNFYKKINFGLLLITGFMAFGGTVSLATVLLLATPKEEIARTIPPIVFLALVLYGSCAIILLIRKYIKKKIESEN